MQSEHTFRDIVYEVLKPKDSIRVSLKGVSERLGQAKCQALPFLHSLTGCDTTSAFKGQGKKKGYDILNIYNAAVTTFGSFNINPFKNITEDMEDFQILLIIQGLMLPE